MKTLFLFVFLLLSVSTIVHAQTACPPGTMPYGTGNDPSACGPDNSQSQQPQASQPPAEIWADHYGAIATDFSHGSVGIANGLQNQLSAKQTAIAACQAKGGVTCKVEISYRNQCAALVAGDAGHNTKAGPTIAEAIQKAMQICNAADTNCRAFYDYSGCSLPTRIQ